MGRNYARGLSFLGRTYAAALESDIGPLSEAVSSLRARPLIVVGSGGSRSGCTFAATLHEHYARLAARVLTPLEFITHPVPQTSGVLLLSASGSNADVLAAATHALAAEYSPVVALCARRGTALQRLLAAQRHAVTIEFEGPVQKDGFLATNSLLLTCTVLALGYGASLPSELPAVQYAVAVTNPQRRMSGTDVIRDLVAGVRGPVEPSAFRRPNLIVLATGWSRAAALDLESKWAESGFASVVVTDARNFAHGRHVGLARRLRETHVIGIQVAESPDDTHPTMPAGPLISTLRHLPAETSAAIVQSPLQAEAGGLDALVRVLLLGGAVGELQGIDPGRPRVALFGRRLFHDRVAKAVARRAPEGASAVEDVWIRRKVTPQVWGASSAANRDQWRAACRNWSAHVQRQRIGGVVLDYDGTLCEAHERPSAPAADVGAALSELIDSGLRVGVATGRGRSVLTALRAVIPRRQWKNVLIGAYNGGILLSLDDELPPASIDPVIEGAYRVLASSDLIRSLADLRPRRSQLTVRPTRPLPDDLLRRFVVEALLGMPVVVLTSDHSVDVVTENTSKSAVVESMRKALPPAPAAAASIMTIGDQGRYGGNDCVLLAQPLGLSVDNPSSRFDGCWSVAAPGSRRTVALLGYLRALRPNATGGFRWSPRRAWRLSHPGRSQSLAGKQSGGS
jgi:hypothetical protein